MGIKRPILDGADNAIVVRKSNLHPWPL